MKSKFYILITLLLSFLLFSCDSVRMTSAKSVANYFSKALLKGNLKQAKKLSTLSQEEIKQYISKISGKYKDFSVNQNRTNNNNFLNEISFIPNNMDAPNFNITLTMKRKGKEFRVAGIKEKNKFNKEGTVKTFIKYLINNNLEQAKKLTNISNNALSKIIKQISGFTSFEVLQLTQNSPEVMVEVKKGDNSKIINMIIKTNGSKFIITSAKVE